MIIITLPALGYNAPTLQGATEGVGLSPVALPYVDSETQGETTPWMLLSFAPYEAPPEPPAIVITGVTPDTFGQQGADELVIEATGLVVGTDYEVYVGPNGDATDTLAWGGAGYGNLPQSLDGATLVVYTPPLQAGEMKLTVRQVVGDLWSEAFTVTVLERPFFGRQFSIRQSFPAWYATGARRLDLEDPL